MSNNKTKLQNQGYQYDVSSQIWSRPEFSSIAYNDGDEVETRLSQIIADASDLSVLSLELRQNCSDWPSLYHLSGTRANILRPLHSELNGARVLEIGAGCGAITRYLGEAGAQVLALEGSLRRATIARSRTRDLDNVVVVADRFAEFDTDERFDVITLIGVLEYANLFTPGEAPAVSMLQRVRELLKPGGRLVIAIENQLGLKYLAGAPEDHVGLSMYGIEELYHSGQAQTFGHAVLQKILKEGGYTNVNTLLPLPDYKFPTSIISERGIETPNFDSSALAWQCVRRDPQFPAHINFRQELAWPVIFANDLAVPLSNSFLLIAENGPSTPRAQDVLAYHFSTDRKPEFCKETLFRARLDGSISVQYRLLAQDCKTEGTQAMHFLPEQEADYCHGTVMSWQFIRTVTRDGWSVADIVEFFRGYRSALMDILTERGINIESLLGEGELLLPGDFLDIIPQNIVISSAGHPQVIDQEWRSTTEIHFSQLVFRSMLAMSGMISYFGRPASNEFPTWRSLLQALFQKLQLKWLPQTEDDLVAFEVGIQETATGTSSINYFMNWLASEPHNQSTVLDVQQQNLQLADAIAERDRLIDYYHANSLAKDAELLQLKATANGTDAHQQLVDAVAERDRLIEQYHANSLAKDAELTQLKVTVNDQSKNVQQAETSTSESTQIIEEGREREQSLSRALEDSRHQLEVLNYEIAQLRSSTSWKVTAPLRFLSHQVKRSRHLLRLAPTFMQRKGKWNAIRRVIAILRQEGLEGIKWRLRMLEGRSHLVPSSSHEELGEVKLDYDEWIRRYDTLEDQARSKIRARINTFSWAPKFSLIMPVYDPPLEFLDEAIRSVRSQLYPHWELCIADDASKNDAVRDLLKKHAAEDKRIRLVLRKENGHISKASNSALEIAQGDFIAMFDHDDLIPEHALYMFAEELNNNPTLDFLYSDQDKVDTSGRRYDPYFKPDFNPDLLRSQNFVDHLAVFRASIARSLGGWRSAFDGSQDYDFVLRFTERLPVEKIAHIPHVLYHWRAVPGSLAIDAGAKNYAATRSRQALAEHLQRMDIDAKVTSEYPHLSIHRVIYPLPIEPLVSIVIPTKDGVDILRQCMDGIFNHTNYTNFEVIIVNNQSEKSETQEYFEELLRDKRVRIIDFDYPFNYSRINNIAVKEANGSVLALLNNDLEVINRDWLREMVSHAVRPEIGAVGARLFYPDGTVQHAGVLLGYKGRAGHMYRYAPRHWLGYWARAVLIQNLTAVTAACLVLRKDVYDSIGGFDEENFTITFNDVDLCLRIHERGFRNLYTPYAELYHHESKTRGLMAFQSEEDYFSERWKPYIQYDTAYNPNLSLETEDFSLAFPPRTTRPWESESSRISAKPLVSIITRTHGERQEFLKESIQSVLRQTYRPLQLVIVEDGSDNARQVVDELLLPAGLTVTYEALPKHGRCFAGNRGIELAQGELFGFLDDDDLLLPDHVESLVAQLQAHPEAAAAYSSSWEIPTEVISLSPLKYVEGKKSLFGRAHFSIDALWNYNYIAIQSLLIKKDLFLKHGGFAEELDCLEDWDLWLRYTSEHDFVFLDKATSAFRMPDNESVLSGRRDQHLQYLPTLRKRQKELLDRHAGDYSYSRLKSAFKTIQT
jgi:glycosyltransferase involved in cell wall biosynthesis/2-polyprenyl-3-methyl-5-hydroxy-6-metoxy-1,4-benzoquinol methylase